MWTLGKRIDRADSNQSGGMKSTSLARERLRTRWAARGQSLVEMALVLPMFLLLVCAVVDFSHIFYSEMTIQNALREAGRFATTGNHLMNAQNQTETRVQSIIQTAQQAAPGFDFTNINVSSVSGGAGSAGGPRDIVTISLTTTVPILTPIIAPFFSNGAYTFTVSVTFKNEPFPASQT